MLQKHNWREPSLLTEVFERDRCASNKIQGRHANKKGRTAEERALAAVAHIAIKFTWMQNHRLATKPEDAKGIDVVVNTSIGPLYIQVKSSRTGVRHYKERRRKARVVIVIIEPEMTDEKIREKITGALHAIRKHILILRQKNKRTRKARSA